jgi:hypothetical protein
MRKDKSKSSYTNKWLNRNKHLWYEGNEFKREITFKPNACVPNIVKEHVKKINKARLYKLFEELYED